MKTIVKIESTRFPRMTRAIVRRVGLGSLEDVARHSADAGWNGFTYYSDTLAFYKAHKADILALAEQSASELGEDMLAMIAGFGCLREYKLSPSAVGEAIYSGRGEDAAIVRNAMAWFALEETARELNPDV